MDGCKELSDVSKTGRITTIELTWLVVKFCGLRYDVTRIMPPSEGDLGM
jgi:hypothetical protein